MNNMKNKDLKKVFFRRANSDQQLQEQEMADEKYRKTFVHEDCIVINESNVPGLPFKERKTIKGLSNLIQEGIVDELYVYDISRLSRDISVYWEFKSFLNKHNVKLVITNDNKCVVDLKQEMEVGAWQRIIQLAK